MNVLCLVVVRDMSSGRIGALRRLDDGEGERGTSLQYTTVVHPRSTCSLLSYSAAAVAARLQCFGGLNLKLPSTLYAA